MEHKLLMLAREFERHIRALQHDGRELDKFNRGRLRELRHARNHVRRILRAHARPRKQGTMRIGSTRR